MEILLGSHSTPGAVANISLLVLFQYLGDAKVGEDRAGVGQSLKHLDCQLNQVSLVGIVLQFFIQLQLEFVDSEAPAH